jgi:hypothetical protein
MTDHALIGVVSSGSVLDGDMIGVVSLVGSLFSTSNLDGDMIGAVPLAGALFSVSGLDGDMTGTVSLVGTSDSASDFNGAILMAYGLRGEVEGVSNVVGEFGDLFAALSGSFSSASALSAETTFVWGLIGRIREYAVVHGTLTGGRIPHPEEVARMPVLVGILTALGNRVQDLEDALWQILMISIDRSTGDALDKLGKQVGEAREGREDLTYRLGIKIRLLLNRCEGTPEQIIKIFATLSNSPIIFKEFFPAALRVEIVNEIIEAGVPAIYKRYLEQCKPAAVEAHLLWTPHTPVKKFDTSGQGFDVSYFAGAL